MLTDESSRGRSVKRRSAVILSSSSSSRSCSINRREMDRLCYVQSRSHISVKWNTFCDSLPRAEPIDDIALHHVPPRLNHPFFVSSSVLDILAFYDVLSKRSPVFLKRHFNTKRSHSVKSLNSVISNLPLYSVQAPRIPEVNSNHRVSVVYRFFSSSVNVPNDPVHCILVRHTLNSQSHLSCVWCKIHFNTSQEWLSHLHYFHQKLEGQVVAPWLPQQPWHVDLWPCKIVPVGNDWRRLGNAKWIPMNFEYIQPEARLVSARQPTKLPVSAYMRLRARSPSTGSSFVSASGTSGGNGASDDTLGRKRRFLKDIARKRPKTLAIAAARALSSARERSRTFYHARSWRPRTVVRKDDESTEQEQESSHDSATEIPVEWLTVKRDTLLDEFSDVTNGEKAMMKLWNRFLLNDTTHPRNGHRPLSFTDVSDTCLAFVQQYRPLLLPIRVHFVGHLLNLVAHGLLAAVHVQQCLFYLNQPM